MSAQIVFGVSAALSFLVWGIITQQYIWPALRSRPNADALRPLLLLHAFRFVGLVFVVPGVVSPDLPADFAGPAAYGDLATAILALLSLATLRTPLGPILLWAFNLVGTVDLLNAVYQGNRMGAGFAPALGAAFFIPTVLVPLLLITHGLVFRILLRKDVQLDRAAVQGRS